ncbi:OLC1v1012905C1 [Oldenlandia corymbosa var. corymbosa]|uniref:OLC1v1012905C1 n=1 Tax=Oldenlandia corymbosa var. corymbosa TaxID=529605 RepID=A0AAV1E0L3_OLDCO|nr:OLC1v1012905C1 [Oldenlandia corymbosa var. corymbosa]
MIASPPRSFPPVTTWASKIVAEASSNFIGSEKDRRQTSSRPPLPRLMMMKVRGLSPLEVTFNGYYFLGTKEVQPVPTITMELRPASDQPSNQNLQRMPRF